MLPARIAGLALITLLGVVAPTWAAGETATTPKNADRVLIVKSTRTLTLMSGGEVLKTYRVALGGDPVGPKVKIGDKKTPEGQYVIDSKNSRSLFSPLPCSR